MRVNAGIVGDAYWSLFPFHSHTVMNKTQFYLSQCAEAASKSTMCFTLGAIMVKGGKVISSGHNHHRPHYEGPEVLTHGHCKVSRTHTLASRYCSLISALAESVRGRKPMSMHAEMHAIFSLTGMSPSFKTQVQGMERRVLPGQKQLGQTRTQYTTPTTTKTKTHTNLLATFSSFYHSPKPDTRSWSESACQSLCLEGTQV